jgi:predicted glycosyltransferase
LTPKQVMFFKPLVDTLLEDDHDVLCTSRGYREAAGLAKIKNLELKMVGMHGGEDKYEKLRASAFRIFELAEIVKAFDPDLTITFSSPEGARVSFGLGIKHYCVSDSPHAIAVSKLTIPLADLLFCPWIIPYSAWTKFGLARSSIIKYKALDPAAWLKRAHNSASTIDLGIGPKKTNKKNILVRLEESKAAYLTESPVREHGYLFLDSLVESVGDLADIVVICRYDDQVTEVGERYQNKVCVIKNVIEGMCAIESCDLFVGAGGTMTAEACLMGKPAISIAPISFYVERYLIGNGLLSKASRPNELVILAKNILTKTERYMGRRHKANAILENMEDPIAVMMRYITGHQ